MKKRIPRQKLPLSHKTFEAITGEHCPANGWWVPVDGEGEGLFIVEGNLVPPNKGQPITWVLVTGDRSPSGPKHAHPPAGAYFD
jgi:hypothetical protein